MPDPRQRLRAPPGGLHLSDLLPSTAVCGTCGSKKPRPGLGFPCPSCDDHDPVWIPYGEYQRVQRRAPPADPSPDAAGEAGKEGPPEASLDQAPVGAWETSSHIPCHQGGDNGGPREGRRAEIAAEQEAHGPESFDPYRGLAVPPCAEGEIRHLMCNGCGWIHIQPITCKRRTCPSCAHVRYKELLARYSKVSRNATYPKLLTLTLKRGDDPAGMVSWILDCFARLRRRAIFKHQEGGAYFLEGKPPEHDGQGWNVHLHVVVDGPPMPQAILAREWEEITETSRIVDIRKVSKKGGLAYALGYSLKGSKVKATWEGASEDLREAWERATKHRRLCQTFGTWHNIPHEEKQLTCPECESTSWTILEYLGRGGAEIAGHLGLSLFTMPGAVVAPAQRKLEAVV